MVKWLHGYIAKFPNFPISKFLYCLLFGFVVLASSFLLLASSSSADELDEINKKIQELKRAREMSVEATTPLVAQLENIEEILTEVVAKLNAVSIGIQRKKSELIDLEGKIAESEELLTFQKEVLKQRVRALYIRNTSGTPFLIFLSKGSAADITREFAIRKAASLEDKKVITTVSTQLKTLIDDKKKAQELKSSLEAEQIKLASSQKEYDEQAVFFRKEIAGARDYQSDIEKQIAELTARQEAILTARSGTFTTSVGEVPVSSIPCSGPPGSPVFCDPGGGNWFAVFSFGAWTHRKGMSQYGAKGRADAGQNYDEILRAYYSFDGYEDRSGITIRVNDGNGVNQGSVIWSGNLEDYVKRIYEVPNNWPSAVLQAQAIAARSYVLAVTGNGAGTICANQHCQVFKKESKGENWENAVLATSGKVVISGGEPVKAFYSSTAGGYLTTSGWDTTDGQGGTGFASRAWESKAGSPWFYSSWFTQSYHAGSSTCNRSHPWLSSDEMADILNAWVVRRRGSGEEVARVLPVTVNACPLSSLGGGDPYSHDELKQKAAQLEKSFSSVTGVSVTYSNEGQTASVSFQTDKGTRDVPGSEFKEAFNLRAPGYIAIRSPLFNVEKK